MRYLLLVIMATVLVCGGCSDGSSDNGGTTDSDSDSDSDTDTDTDSCTGCLIGSECFPDGVANPLNSCEVCDTANSTTYWTDNNGISCDDGLFCNGADTCLGGTCSVHSGDPCGDDGLFCNGAESCNETGDVCDHSGDPCVDDGLFCNGPEVCNEIGDVCDHSGDPCPDDGIFCNGTESCNETGDVCDHTGDPCISPMICDVDECACENHWEGINCDICPGNWDPDQDCNACLDYYWGGDCENFCVRYVDFGASGGDGLSWVTATWDLQSALNSAGASALSSGGRCAVWIAAGTWNVYYSSIGDVIDVPDRVDVYGGFDMTESDPSERDLLSNETILDGSDGISGMLHVTNAIITAGDNRLDGLTIANVGSTLLYSSAIRAYVGPLTIANSKVVDNDAQAIRAESWTSSNPLVVENTSFENNGVYGDLLINLGQAQYVTFVSCTFLNNKGKIKEGAFGTPDVSIAFDDCYFEGNTNSGPTYPHPLIYMASSAASADGLQITNSTFVDNTVKHLIYLGQSNAFIDNSTFINNASSCESLGGGVVKAHGSSTTSVVHSLVIQGSEFSGNSCGSGVANPSQTGGAVSVGINLDVQISDCQFTNNTAGGQGGAIYVDDEFVGLSISGSTFDGNESFTDEARPTDGLYLNPVSYSTTEPASRSIFIENSQFDNHPNYAINLTSYIDSSYTGSLSAEITNTGFSNNYFGAYIYRVNNVVITDNEFGYHSFPWGGCLSISCCTLTTCCTRDVTGNVFHHNTGYSYYNDGGSGEGLAHNLFVHNIGTILTGSKYGVMDAVFAGNSGPLVVGTGDGLYTVVDSVMSRNEVSSGDLVLANHNLSVYFQNNIVVGNHTAIGATFKAEDGDHGHVENNVFAGNTGGPAFLNAITDLGWGGTFETANNTFVANTTAIHNVELGQADNNVANCILWDNDQEITFDTDYPEVTYNDIQGDWGSPLAQNIDIDPAFLSYPAAVDGTWSDVQENAATWQTELTTNSGPLWTSGALSGLLLVNQAGDWHYIASNTEDTVFIWGHFGADFSIGDIYSIIDLRLSVSSPCVDAGNDSFGPLTDLLGNPRNDEIPGGTVIDHGAYEYW